MAIKAKLATLELNYVLLCVYARVCVCECMCECVCLCVLSHLFVLLFSEKAKVQLP